MTDNPAKTIFLTGVTGALGREILKTLLATTDDRFILLARGKKKLSHLDRMRKILSAYGKEDEVGARVRVFDGDVTRPKLGLKDEDYILIVREADEIFHIAALTALNGSKEDCFRINFNGTEEVMRLARECREKGKLRRLFYFSTAYVAGSLQTYHSKEDGLPEHPRHANHYEASKFAAEGKVRELMAGGFPVTIFRPSIVVGDSKTGEVSEFNVIYPFMKLFAHGILKRLPTRLDNTFNIVPVDFVVNASLAIATQPDSIGKTFHLVSKDPPSIGMLLEVKEKEYPQMPAIEILDPSKFDPKKLNAEDAFLYQMLTPYLGYLNDKLTFDVTNTQKALESTDVDFPKTDYQFLSTLTRYAVTAGYILA